MCVCVCVCVCANRQVESSEKVNVLHSSSPEAGEVFLIVPINTYSIAGIRYGITSQYHRHTSPVHEVNKAVDKGHWNHGPYTDKSYTRVTLHRVFIPQVL